MIDGIDYKERIVGPHGVVDYVPFPNSRNAKTPTGRAAIEMCRGQWLIYSPGWHPLWSQYILSVIHLGSHLDLPPAVLKFEGATHEMLLLAVNPEHPQTVKTVQQHDLTGTLPFLKPVNIAEQFECTDDEIRTVAWLAARAVVEGNLNPETSDAPSLVREQWLTACTKAFAHLRGEAHAP